MKITAHFALEEFTCRDGTPYPAAWINSRLVPLCEQLEILRAELGGVSVAVNSGYRTPSYNASIGGARASQHMEGRAADIVVKGRTPKVVHDTALRLYNAGALRIGGLGRYPTFTHVDIRPGTRLARWEGSRAGN